MNEIDKDTLAFLGIIGLVILIFTFGCMVMFAEFEKDAKNGRPTVFDGKVYKFVEIKQ